MNAVVTENLQASWRPPLWLRLATWLLVVATVVMVALGSIVTTFRVGMADRLWPTTPWHLLFIDWTEPQPGFLIEHTHRLMGHILGVILLTVTVGLWLYERRTWLKWTALGLQLAMVVTLALGFATHEMAMFYTCVGVVAASVLGLLVVAIRYHDGGVWMRCVGTAALGFVIIQGLLGGFRVSLNALMGTELAMIHGSWAQFVLGVIMALGWLVLRRPGRAEAVAVPASFPTLAAVTVVLVLIQIVLGAVVRHTASPAGQRLHLLTAFVVFGLALLVIRGAFQSRDRGLRRVAIALKIVLVGQILFGVEAWMTRFAGGHYADYAPVTTGQAVIRTGHVLLGSGVLATTLIIALSSYHMRKLHRSAPPAGGRLEGVA